MQRKENFIPFFLVFFGLSLSIILLGRIGILNPISSVINNVSEPVRISAINIFGYQNKTIKNLNDENARLRKEVLNKNDLVLENKALKDQFLKSESNSTNLLPARVIGFPGFIPGVTNPSQLIIDKGINDGVKKGSVVVSGEYLVGKVIKASSSYSKVELLNDKKSSFTAKVESLDGASANGVIKGQNGEMSFENILLTLLVKKDDLVLTKGDIDEGGSGYPPGIVVGKIISVEKKSSNLFQKAKVISFLDFANLSTVFVIK